jgi:nucleotidyltransferase substrate binding protein (TIGR01987 family)
MDAKFTKRYSSYKNSLTALTEARTRDLGDSFVLSGTSSKFCITFDLAWKVMKDILVQHYSISDFVAGSPKEVLRKAFAAGLIDDDTWMEMLSVRNELVHDYDGAIITEHCKRIVSDYIDIMSVFEQTVDKLDLE